MTAHKCVRIPAVITLQGFGSADDPFMQDSEEPMYPGALVQKVEDKHHQDAAPADEEEKNGGEDEPKDEPEDSEEEPLSLIHI